jgi:Rha family phage regulatory protein
MDREQFREYIELLSIETEAMFRVEEFLELPEGYLVATLYKGGVTMSNLQIKNQLTLDSREVAEMVEKNHGHLLRDIKTYIEYISADPNLDSLEFFIPSTYIDAQGKERPNYQITKKGCEFIAHKLTGQKGVLFTASYINRFHEMEQALSQPKAKALDKDNIKTKEIEARLLNARARQARLLMQISDRVEIPEYKQILNAKATEIITGESLLPLPEIDKKTYSATEIGGMLGISANKVGRLANQHDLKTSEFGKWFYDKAKNADKQVETFRYYDKVIPIIRDLMGTS